MEPPLRAHPVVGFGRYLGAAERRVPSAPPGRAMAAGAVAWSAGAAGAAALGLGLERVAARAGRPWGALLRGLVLWPLLSARMLFAEVTAVETALADGPASGARALSRIVSRDTEGLSDDGDPRRCGGVAGREPLGLPGGAAVLVRRRGSPRCRRLSLRQHRRRQLGLPHAALAVRRPPGRPRRRRAEPRARPADRSTPARPGRTGPACVPRRARPRRPTPAGRWPRWRCGSTCG